MTYPSTVHAGTSDTSESGKIVRRDARARGERSGARRADGRSSAGRKPSGGQVRSRNGARSVPPVRDSHGGRRTGRQEAGSQDEVRPGTTRMFATVVPGMAVLVTRQLDRLPGIRVTDAGFDGRSDLVLFDVDRGHREL